MVRIHDIHEANKLCTICLSPLHKRRQSKQLSCECRVIFHNICLQRWLNENNTCPICHTELTHNKNKIEKIYNFVFNKIKKLKKFFFYNNNQVEIIENRQEINETQAIEDYLELTRRQDRERRREDRERRIRRRRHSVGDLNPNFFMDNNRNLDYNGIQVINRNTGVSYTIPRIRGISPRVFNN